ncbi:MAG: metallophosphoesterase family protein, partial [Phycisphaerae bacterium]
MIVGILSDSHGDALATARAVELLDERGAEVLFHCGDVCGTDVLDALAGRRAHFVWGNCDQPPPAWRAYVTTIGLKWPDGPLHVTLEGKRIALAHGHEREFEGLFRDPELDYVFFGHSHVYEDRRARFARGVNPGALHRARIKTVATLD